MAPPPPFTDAVKKVDRAVSRLEELQSTLRSRNPDTQRQTLRHDRLTTSRQKVDIHVDDRRPRRPGWVAATGDTACGKEWRRWSTSAALVDGTVADVVKALGSVGEAGKENAGVKKKRRKKSLPATAELSPAVGRSQRRALESRPVNVVTEQAFSPSSSGSDIKNVGLASGENARPKRVCSGSNGRPPWRSFAMATTNNLPAPTIAERVRPISAVSGRRSAAKIFDSPELPTPAKARRRSSLPASGGASKAGVAGAGPGLGAARPAFAQENVEFSKTFYVDVRSGLNRPWRLAPKSNPSQPLTMLPKPACRSSERAGKVSQEEVVSDKAAKASGQQGSDPKLKSFQFRPLKLATGQQQQHQILPPTIRPRYLSPSKTRPHDHLSANKVSNTIAPPSSCNSKSNKAKKENWLSKRLSLPYCSPSSTTLMKRFSLLHNKEAEGSPAKPLPSLITRLPTRGKPTNTSFDSLLLTKTLSSTTSNTTTTNTTTTITPLPLPPALRMEHHPIAHQTYSHSPSHKKLSSSCQLQPLDGNFPLVEGAIKHSILPRGKENLIQRSLSSRGPQDTLDSTKKKQSSGLHCGAFRGCGSSAWPSMKRSFSLCQHRTLECTNNCTGAGPCLLKHVIGGMHNNKPISS